LSLSDGAIIEEFAHSSTIPDGLPAGVGDVEGLFSFTLSNVTPGGAIDATFTFSSSPPPDIDGFYKYLDSTWVSVPASLVDLSVPGQATVTLVDGGPYDSDQLANGTIVDPIMPVAVFTVPTPPTITSITFDDDHRAQVSYTPGSDGGQPFISHFVNCSGPDSYSGGGAVGLINPLPVSFQINTPSSPATVMQCTMGSINSVGESSRSAVFTVTTPATPGRPTAVTTSSPAGGTIRVYFTRPWYPVRNGVGAGVTYVATCTSTDGTVTVTGERFDNPIDIEGVPGGLSYTCEIASKNAFGTGPSSPRTAPLTLGQTRPAQPAKPTVTQGSNSVTVAWTPPADGGSAITGYSVTASPGGATCSPNSVATTACTVTGLLPAVAYTFRVTATNARGTSDPSPASDPVSLGTLPGAPTVDTALTVAIDADRNAEVVFAPPSSDGGAPVIEYVATCTSSNGGLTRTASAPSAPIKVSGLSPARTYTCRVAAVNAIGTGPLSAPTRAFTTPTVAGRPTGVTATPSGSRQVSVAYTAPAYTGSTAITGYTLRCSSTDGGVAPANVVGSANPLVMNLLTAGKTYTCTVTAQNGSSAGATSVPTAPFVAPGLPGVPRDVQVTITGSSAASVTFLPPADNVTYPATGYSVTCTSSNGGTAKTVTGATSPIAVTGLSTTKTYTCAVRSTNGAGTSAAVTSAAFTLPLPPTPTDVVATTTSSTTATVAFVPGEANSSDTVTTHTATCTSSTGGVTRSANLLTSPIAVASLTPGATYTCTVTAKAGTLPGVASAPSAAFTLPRPPAPTDVVVTMSGTLASVAFVPAAANGSTTVTTHTADCTSSTGGTTRSASLLTSPITVTSLTPGATYTCTVTAKAGSLSGPASLPSAAFTVATAPAAPTDVTITLDGTGLAALIGFTASADGGSAITSYSVRCSSTATGVAARTATGVTGPLVVTGLSAGATYTCAVTARNTVGTGAAASAALTGQTAPPAPSGVSVTVPGTPGTVLVSFTPAVSGPSAQAVAWHRVTCTPTAGGTARTAQVVAGPAIVSGLAAKTAYSCVVAAGTAAGVLGSPSSAATFTTN
jgi:titin